MHIPDGVLPTWLWVSGWIAAVALVYFASAMAGRHEIRRRVPLVGVVSALVLVAMSSEIVPIAYHVNLTVVAGVLLGPWLGAVAAFIVVVALALLGHGGVTVIGLNALVIASEMAIGWGLFRLLVRVLGRTRLPWAAAAATVVALAVTTTMLVGIVALAGDVTTRETGALEPSTLRFDNPFSKGVFSINTLRGEASPAAEHAGSPTLSVARFAAIVYTLGPIGWVIEAIVTAIVLGYVARLRPSLVFAGALEPTPRRAAGHHGEGD